MADSEPTTIDAIDDEVLRITRRLMELLPQSAVSAVDLYDGYSGSTARHRIVFKTESIDWLRVIGDASIRASFTSGDRDLIHLSANIAGLQINDYVSKHCTSWPRWERMAIEAERADLQAKLAALGDNTPAQSEPVAAP